MQQETAVCPKCKEPYHEGRYCKGERPNNLDMKPSEMPDKADYEKRVEAMSNPQHDPVNHPTHYTNHPSGIECIQITRHMGFNLGNAMKYIWRADLKNGVEDLEKAIWYLRDELKKRGAK